MNTQHQNQESLMDLIQEAVIRKGKSRDIDVGKEWEKVCRKANVQTERKQPPQHSFIWGAITGIAATILAIFVFTYVDRQSGDTYTPADTKTLGSITLSTDEGKTADIRKDTELDEMFGADISVGDDGKPELVCATAKGDVPVEIRHLQTPTGKDFKVVLADGTTVWMNAETTLDYPTRFEGNTRHVKLKGEAYFKVTKDPSHPFIVEVDGMLAKVLGTELYVKGYGAKNNSVALVNGSVEVTGLNAKKTVMLTPGQEARCNGNDLSVADINTDVYTYWRDGYFYFEDQPLSAVMGQISKWYNVKVDFENKKLRDVRVRYFFVRTESVERAVAILNRMKIMDVTISGNTIHIK